MAAKLKKGDRVVVLAGRDKGKEGEITKVMPKEGRAIVSGVNTVIRHTRQSQTSQGGRIPQEAAIDLSNLAYVDPKEGGPTRVGFRIEDGKKVRYAKKSGETIDA
jgi:large subunit ribosomal protein L24